MQRLPQAVVWGSLSSVWWRLLVCHVRPQPRTTSPCQGTCSRQESGLVDCIKGFKVLIQQKESFISATGGGFLGFLGCHTLNPKTFDHTQINKHLYLHRERERERERKREREMCVREREKERERERCVCVYIYTYIYIYIYVWAGRVCAGPSLTCLTPKRKLVYQRMERLCPDRKNTFPDGQQQQTISVNFFLEGLGFRFWGCKGLPGTLPRGKPRPRCGNFQLCGCPSDSGFSSYTLHRFGV